MKLLNDEYNWRYNDTNITKNGKRKLDLSFALHSCPNHADIDETKSMQSLNTHDVRSK